jgi:hypothetical protein
MAQPLPFWEVLEAADQLSADEQERLLEILRHRLAAQARNAIALNIQEAREEFAQGGCRAATVDEIMKEALP